MPMPEGWKGSDGRSRAEVALWLKQHGGHVEDPTGLIVGRMRQELGKGRALSQLLADMEHDGMLRREVRGRRTLSIRLLDDWGLADDLSRQPVYRAPGAAPAPAASETGTQQGTEPDYDQLAAALLARVVRQAHAVPSNGAEVEALRSQVAALTADLADARANVAHWMAEAEEQRTQADTMRKNIIELQAAIDRPQAKASTTKLRDAIAPRDRKLLDRLMREVPAG